MIAAIIEARMTSTRLPGKHMLLANKKPMIEHLVYRLKQVLSVNEIVMATTVNDSDEPLVELAKRMGISFFCGSEPNVMERVIGAAESVNADIVVGITGDCPVIDPMLVEQTIQMFIHNKCDYVNNAHVPGYPGGMNTQVYRLTSLKKSAAMTKDPFDHEHVTSHMFRNPRLFNPIYLMPPPDLYWPELMLELDEEKDYILLKKIIEHFGDDNQFFSCSEIIDLLRENREWANINSRVIRKGYE